jgi:two-component system sensor histidine kinase KdpD
VRREVRDALSRFAACTAAFAVVVVAYVRWLHVNPATVGFSLLLLVLLIAAAWGLRFAIYSSALGTLAYNYFFLPPVRTITIADPQNWIALIAFLVTAVVASQLSERARRSKIYANQRRSEVERLYGFSQQLWLSENVFELLNVIPKHLVESFEVTQAALFIEAKQETYFLDEASRSNFHTTHLKAISERGEPVLDREHRLCYMPLRMGVRSVGSLGVAGCDLSRESLEAIASLVAISIERASTVESLTRSEAARESERLRSVLLDSVTHEFRTPLTAIKASAETLASEVELDRPTRKDLISVINEEADRLNRLVGEAAEVAELDGRHLQFHLEPHPLRQAIDDAINNLQNALKSHPLNISIPLELAPVRMDLLRITEVVAQLLDNAAKYSAIESPIHITVEKQGNQVITSVADRGSGIDPIEKEMIFEKFYRGRNQRIIVQGTGMGLAIAKAIVEFHGGRIGVTSQPERGSVFYFSLPA